MTVATDAKALAVFIKPNGQSPTIDAEPGLETNLHCLPYNGSQLHSYLNVLEDSIRQTLAECWERTKDTEVPQFRNCKAT